MNYEGTFLVAVSTAYFLALNALAAYLFIQVAQLRERLRDQEARLAAAGPGLATLERFGQLTLESGSERLKPFEDKGGDAR